jgi:nucleotide-binding universal stress UspA family protein
MIEPRSLEDDQAIRAELSAFLRGIDSGGAKWNIMTRTGEPREVILQEAERRGSDLLSLGTNGRTGLKHALVGSVAERILRAAACDVLVARLPQPSVNL